MGRRPAAGLCQSAVALSLFPPPPSAFGGSVVPGGTQVQSSQRAKHSRHAWSNTSAEGGIKKKEEGKKKKKRRCVAQQVAWCVSSFRACVRTSSARDFSARGHIFCLVQCSVTPLTGEPLVLALQVCLPCMVEEVVCIQQHSVCSLLLGYHSCTQRTRRSQQMGGDALFRP